VDHYELSLNGVHVVTGLQYAFANLNPYSFYTVGVAAVNGAGLHTSIVDSAPLLTGPGPGGFTMLVSPTSVTLDTTTVVGVSGGNAVPNTRVDIAIDGHFVVTTVSGADGTYSTSFTVQADGTVFGTPDNASLGPGDHDVMATTSECGCPDVARHATLTVEPAP
jgi:hypothetical protein